MCGLLLGNFLLKVGCEVLSHKSLGICSKRWEVITVLCKGIMGTLLLMIAMHNIQNKENTRTLENNIWEAFKNVRDFASKISQWKSNCYFYEACIREHLGIKGLRINNIGTFYDSNLRSRCREHAVEAERKITDKNFEFAERRKKEVYKELLKWKTELFRAADIEESKNLWNKVKTEIDRSRKRLTERKDKKLTRLREEKQR